MDFYFFWDGSMVDGVLGIVFFFFFGGLGGEGDFSGGEKR